MGDQSGAANQPDGDQGNADVADDSVLSAEKILSRDAKKISTPGHLVWLDRHRRRGITQPIALNRKFTTSIFYKVNRRIYPVIFANNGGAYSRAQLKNFAQFMFVQIIKHNYNKKAIADLYNIIWHCDITPDTSFERIIVMPPLEVREKCDKIARRRKNSRQNELDIEAIIMEWCAENNVTPRHAVYTNRPAVLFFDNESALVMAKIALNGLDLICDLEKHCRDAF